MDAFRHGWVSSTSLVEKTGKEALCKFATNSILLGPCKIVGLQLIILPPIRIVEAFSETKTLASFKVQETLNITLMEPIARGSYDRTSEQFCV